jgi:hypothetical protein
MRRGPKKSISVLMPVEFLYRIRVQAEKRNRSVSSYVRQVMRCYLWHEENDPESLIDEWRIL